MEIFLKTFLKRLFFVLIDARIPEVIHGFFCRRFSFLVKTVNGACLSNTELNVKVKSETPWLMFDFFKSVILIDENALKCTQIHENAFKNTKSHSFTDNTTN